MAENTVKVRDASGMESEYTDAHWHIDERGQLHVGPAGGTSGQLASFARDSWVAVELAQDDKAVLGEPNPRRRPVTIDLANIDELAGCSWREIIAALRSTDATAAICIADQIEAQRS